MYLLQYSTVYDFLNRKLKYLLSGDAGFVHDDASITIV